MMVHVFSITEWFFVPDDGGCVSWDADSGFLVVDQERNVQTVIVNSDYQYEKFCERFPHRIMHTISLSTKHGVLEANDSSDMLQEQLPLIFRKLVKMYGYEDKRS